MCGVRVAYKLDLDSVMQHALFFIAKADEHKDVFLGSGAQVQQGPAKAAIVSITLTWWLSLRTKRHSVVAARSTLSYDPGINPLTERFCAGVLTRHSASNSVL